MGRLFGTDGIRGVANREITCELALSVGRAVAHILQGDSGEFPSVLVGYDTRLSSDMLSGALTAGLCSGGASVTVVGLTSTPSLAYLVKELDYDCAIMLTASHNSWEYNGIKIFAGNGYKLPDILEEKIEDLIANPTKDIPDTVVGSVGYYPHFIKKYISHLMTTTTESLAGYKICLDCANGSASEIAQEIFEDLGAEVHVINNIYTGYNINMSCGSTHMEGLRDYVLENGMDAGIAFDGDADRCLCVDEKGNLIDGDLILAMCATDMMKRGVLKNNAVVGTIMTNFGFNKFCKINNLNFITTKVGDRYVLEEMLLGGYNLGGEQSGHIIFSDYATTGDGLVTAIQVLSLLPRYKKPLSELSKVMTSYPQSSYNVRVSNSDKAKFYTDPDIATAIQEAMEELGSDGRIVVRPSGTEPVIRVMTEGIDEEKIKRIAKKVAQVISENLSVR